MIATEPAEAAPAPPGLDDVRARIARAAEVCGRDPAAVRLVAVSKQHPAGAAAAAVAAGQIDLGESRAQELADKVEAVDGARWHFIGRLQRNKVADVVGRCALVHSVDRGGLLEAIAQRAERLGVVQRVLVQVDVVGDEAKAGCRPEQAAALVDAAARRRGVACVGLSTMPPAERAERAYEGLAALRARLAATHRGLVELSMGLSADLEEAVARGATMVRVGQAVFGPRPGPAGVG